MTTILGDTTQQADQAIKNKPIGTTTLKCKLLVVAVALAAMSGCVPETHHTSMTDRIAVPEEGLLSPHTPDSDCGSCHREVEPGVLSGLIAEVPELCYSCHTAEQALFRSSKHTHLPVAEGKCLTCHEKHASNFANLLKEYDLDICRRCHKEDHPHNYKANVPKDFKIREGSKCKLNERGELTCISCHGAHGSDERAMTHYDPDRRLCAECHLTLLQDK